MLLTLYALQITILLYVINFIRLPNNNITYLLFIIIYLQIIVQHQQSDDFDNEPCSPDFSMSIFRCSSTIL